MAVQMEFDLHMHSKYSFDSSMKPEKIVEVAKIRGLSGIAVTDHNSCKGGIETMQYTTPDFMVIPGFEQTTTAGDVIGLFMTECPDTKDPREVVRFIHEGGGLAVLPHPSWRHLAINKELLQELDAIEGFNARHTRRKRIPHNHDEDRLTAFAKEHDLALLGSSDAHFYAEIGAGRTTISAATPEEAKEAILRKDTGAMGEKSPVFYLFMTGARAFPFQTKHRIGKMLTLLRATR